MVSFIHTRTSVSVSSTEDLLISLVLVTPVGIVTRYSQVRTYTLSWVRSQMKDLHIDAIQSLYRFKVKMLHQFEMKGFKATQLLHCCKRMVFGAKKAQNCRFLYIKGLKLQNRCKESFLRKQRIGFAVINFFFLNYAAITTTLLLVVL